MADYVKVAVDAMGGDNAPAEIVKGAVEAIQAEKKIKVFLVGKEEQVKAELAKYTYPQEQVEVVNATEVIAMAEPPVAVSYTHLDVYKRQVDPYGPVSEEVTLHVGRSEDTGATYLDGQDSSNNYLVNYISEKLGVKYEYDFSVPSDTYETKVSMAITSGEFPDVMVVNESQLRQLVAAGAVEDMTDAYNKYAACLLYTSRCV